MNNGTVLGGFPDGKLREVVLQVDEEGRVLLRKEDKDQLNRIETMLEKLMPPEWVGGPK